MPAVPVLELASGIAVKTAVLAVVQKILQLYWQLSLNQIPDCQIHYTLHIKHYTLNTPTYLQ